MDTELNSLFQTLTSIENFTDRYAEVVRDARDYVIDADKTGRTLISQAEKAEKTIFGMKVEAYLRSKFGREKGKKLDFYIGDVEFDSKATIGNTWMVPPEAVGGICLLTSIDEAKGIFNAGLVRATDDALTAGENQDK